MVKTRAIAKKQETPNTTPVINTELPSSENITPSSTQLIMPKSRNGDKLKAVATAIDVPKNSRVDLNATSGKRTADQSTPTPTIIKRCKVIQPKNERLPIARLPQPKPANKRVIKIAPMPNLTPYPYVHPPPILLPNVNLNVTRERLLAPALVPVAQAPMAVNTSIKSSSANSKSQPTVVPKPIAPSSARPSTFSTKAAPVASSATAVPIASSSTAIPIASSSTVPSKAKKEPKIKKEPKLKKEPKPKKAPAVKKERKTKAKTGFQLPPEASAFMSQSMRGRVLRAMKQKMFVISRELDQNNDSCEKFEVLGSIGNNYTVTVDTRIKCTCMDYAIRRVHCKHILMVLFKVYRLPCSHSMFKSLTTNREQRLEARSLGRVVDPSVLVPPEIRQKIMSIAYKNHPDAAPAAEEQATQRRSLNTSDCPICFEEFEEASIDQIDFCKVCGNNVHKECFSMWASSKGSNVTCVYCRTKWVVSTASESSGSGKNKVKELDREHVHEGYYANYAKKLGIERTRDTSTYRNTYNRSRYRYDYGYDDY